MSEIEPANGRAALGFEQGFAIYLIELEDGKTIIFAPADLVEFFDSQSDDRVHRFISWLVDRRSRVLPWLGRMFQTGRAYYMRLEARLDPVERVLKAMDGASRYIVFHSTAQDAGHARKQLFTRLRRQRTKHLCWFVVDITLSVASLTIAVLPGPNVLGWYPFLRCLSHYRAFRGTHSALRSGCIEFKGLPELRALEENLRVSSFDRARIHAMAESLKLKGLEQFLERMV